MAVEYRDELTFDQLYGGVCSAIPAERLPAPDEPDILAERILQALPTGEPFTEEVRVTILVGQAQTEHRNTP
jgi:hypothetical protein